MGVAISQPTGLSELEGVHSLHLADISAQQENFLLQFLVCPSLVTEGFSVSPLPPNHHFLENPDALPKGYHLELGVSLWSLVVLGLSKPLASRAKIGNTI